MKIAAYCRVSTGSSQQLTSLENQKTFFEDYAHKHSYTLTHIYADHGISGKALKNRTQFQQMLTDGNDQKFDMLVVKDISRFARNTVDFLTGIRFLKSKGIGVRFLSCNMDTLGESEFTLTMFAAIAQEESYNLSKRIIFGKKISASRGRTPSYIYGYNKIGTYDLEINKGEAKTVRKIFELYVKDGLGIRRIADYLNNHKILSKQGREWQAKTVRRILSNPIYCGILVNNKSETLDFLESTRLILPPDKNYVHKRPELAIVTKKIFNQAGNILAQKAKKAVTNRSG